ncbi:MULTISPECIES: VIT1/CCC1 transporter family protein [Caldisericum]|jgi:VIT1/CCC1 family predicted Fe2+/Mn2+ transporter|uniref:VIT1/CCC1 transporter family protein n=1 Tax=Caldisericum TaxID=693074 RepID=UPI0039FBDA79
MNKKLVEAQVSEITGAKIYNFLSEKLKGKNKEILKEISKDEFKHYLLLKKINHIDVKENLLQFIFYKILYYIFGVIFVIKLMERSEDDAVEIYREISKDDEEFLSVLEDEERHEDELIKLIEEERVHYVSSIVLGLNDALVEITGTISGLSSALQNSRTIGVAALITGVAASLSMAASEYISKKTDVLSNRNPLKAAVYTFIAYFLVVLGLVLPFFFVNNFIIGFIFSIVFGFLIVVVFSFYVSVIQDTSFKRTFSEMFLVIIGVIIITFLLGYIARKLFNVSI